MMHDLMDVEYYFEKGLESLKESDEEQAALFFKMAWDKFNNSDAEIIPEKLEKTAYRARAKYYAIKYPKRPNKLKAFFKGIFKF